MRRWFLLFGLLIAAAATGADNRSAPSMLYAPAHVEAAATRLLPSSTAGRSIILPEPSNDERATLKSASAISPRASRTVPPPRPPLVIGFPRIPGPADRVIDLASLAWVPVDRGSAAVVTLTSPTAAAVRLQLRIDLQAGTNPGIELRFAGSNGRQVFGPYAPKDLEGPGLGWSPVLEGDTGTVEIFVAGAQEVMGFIEIRQVSHLVATPADLFGDAAKRVSEIGNSGACEVDVACRSNPTAAYLHQATSSAQIVFTDGFTYLCSGTLLNTAPSSGIPYFYTAHHCIGNSAAAATLNAYWFFAATTCGSHAIPPYIVTAGGSTYLAGDANSDFSFLRLNSPPPPGVYFSAWNANPLATVTPASVFHYPAGDLEKYSIGLTASCFFVSGAASFIEVVYSSGSTEGGSSGSGLLTQNIDGDYELRGGLYGGSASCSNPTGFDVYSRLDLAYPSIASYLSISSCTYTLSPLDLSNLAAAGGPANVTVTVPAGCPVTATSYQPWVTVTSVTPGSGTSTVALQISPNAGAARATSIVVADRLFLITQQAP